MIFYGYMMDSPIDEIKAKLDIVEVIGDYIRLKKAGKDYKALCPFHSEKTPSFFVSPSKQIWHCFGCNLGGDIFSFVQKIEGVEFGDALKILARKAGVTLKKQDFKTQSERSKLYEICQEAAEFFEDNLKKEKEVQTYLTKQRGIFQKIIKEFRIGYAFNSWDALYNHLTTLGFKPSDIEKAGLIIKSTKPQVSASKKTQNYYDRFRNRIMFPICDISGQVIAFTGRIFKGDESTAKYLNSPETLIFNKSRTLFALDKAKVEIRKQDKCILVEGQLDVILSHQAGVKNVIATSGTALTLDHLRIIKRYTNNLYLAFDMDTAGETATKRSIGLAQAMDFNVKVVILPSGKDPADLVKENPEKWKKAIESAKPVMEFYFENVFSKYNPDKVEEKRKIAQELLPIIKRIANEVERAHWIQVLASKLNVHEKLLMEALSKVKIPEEYSGEIKKEEKKSIRSLKETRIHHLEETLLGLALKYPEYLDIVRKRMKLEYFSLPATRLIFEKIKQGKAGKKIDLKKLQKEIVLEQPYYIDHLIFQVEHYNLDKKDVLKEIEFCIKELTSIFLKNELSNLSLEIKKLEKEKDKKKIKLLIEKFNKLSKKLAEL